MAEENGKIDQVISSAVEEVVNGQHSTNNIVSVKQYTSDLILSGQFKTALNILHKLAVARKAKTTNILWIGNYLKDIYFHDDASELKSSFDKLLLDEILFYYLKACKLYEKGYSVIREELKNLKESE